MNKIFNELNIFELNKSNKNTQIQAAAFNRWKTVGRKKMVKNHSNF